MYLNVHSSAIYISQDMEATKCLSTKEWIKKVVVYIYTHTHTHTHTHTREYYSAIKMNGNNSVRTNVDGSRGYYAK